MTPHTYRTNYSKPQVLCKHRGGGFAAAIAQAFFRADTGNQRILVEAFADLFEKFNKEETTLTHRR